MLVHTLLHVRNAPIQKTCHPLLTAHRGTPSLRSAHFLVDILDEFIQERSRWFRGEASNTKDLCKFGREVKRVRKVANFVPSCFATCMSINADGDAEAVTQVCGFSDFAVPSLDLGLQHITEVAYLIRKVVQPFLF